MLDDNPMWYKDAIIYELHVRAFHDSIGDGIGDFRGLTHKLDYLQDLGVTTIWLLPFYPSPLKDDGYDIADYITINPQYGTLRDFRAFLDAAHERGLRVITELVVNHTSDQHPWFQRARRSPPGSPARNFYVWSDTPDKYKDARIIFKDFEPSNWSWDPVAKAYYWHRFYAHQPDLNFDNPAVWEALFPVVDFWMGMGVDGMRLDAVPYLFEREGTNCENLPETHQFLKALRRHVDGKFTSRMLLAEANQWPEDAVAYFGAGDECQMCFHFPVMPRMFMAIHMEDRFPIVDILAQTPAIPDNCQWGMFLRNHDELTLEMVTDEERDYMYRAYAHDPQARINLGIRHRLGPLLGANRRRIELMNGLLFSMPGTPVLYYGDEIGMGDNIYLGDRNGVRTPMQWSADRNAGFSRANPQKLYLPIIIDPEYHYEAINVEAQQNNPNSLLWWMKRLIALRKQFKAFGRGAFELLHPENRKILAFLRRWHPEQVPAAGKGLGDGEECILVVVNLSRFVQYVELDLSAFQGMVPIELFSRNPFPPVGKHPYLLTLGPHAFYWFALNPASLTSLGEQPTPGASLPVLEVGDGGWESIFKEPAASRLEKVLAGYLPERRWFGGKARVIKRTALNDSLRLRYGDKVAYIALVRVEYVDGAPDTYMLPLSFATGRDAKKLRDHYPHTVLAHIGNGAEGVLFDALGDPLFCSALVQAMIDEKSFPVGGGEVTALTFPPFAELRGSSDQPLEPSLTRTEQSNTSIVFGNRFIMKVFRRLEGGINPELELGQFLTQKGFAHAPPLIGAIEHRQRRGEATTLAVLQGYVPNQGDAWQYTLDVISRFFEKVLAQGATQHPDIPKLSLLEQASVDPPDQVKALLDNYLSSAALLGQRTAELHRLLAEEQEDARFTPEPYSTLYQRSVYQSMRNLKGMLFRQLRHKLPDFPESTRDLAQRVLDQDQRITAHFQQIMQGKITALRSRTHGDLHLGQVLYTGKDFVIIDFEGEPSRSINERRIKRSPIRDLAGMIRSFHYAANSPLAGTTPSRGHLPGIVRPEDLAIMESWARFWYSWVASTFLRTYREHANQASFVPSSADEWKLLLDAFLLEKAIYELGYEMNHRPEWVRIPLWGILQLME